MVNAPGQNAVATPLQVDDRTDQSESAWLDIQTTLDDALDAVREAARRNAFLAQALDEKTRTVTELQAERDEWRTRLEETTSELGATKEVLEREQAIPRDPQAAQSHTIQPGRQPDALLVKARRLDKRICFIADTLARLNRRTEEIHSHYSGQIDAEALMAEEINFARDEALAQVRRAMEGIHVTRAERKPHKRDSSV